MHGSCVCEARSLVCDVPPMKGSVNLSGPSPGTAPVDGAGVCIRCSLRCVLSPLVFIRTARVFKGPRMLNRMLVCFQASTSSLSTHQFRPISEPAKQRNGPTSVSGKNFYKIRRPLTERPLPASRNNLSPFPSLKHRYATHFTDTRCYRQSPHLLPARTHSHWTPCSCFLTKDGPLAVNARLSRSNYHVLNCAECTTAATALKSDMAVSSSEPRTHDEPNRL